MKIPLQLLICEDSESDALFIVRELQRNEYEVNWYRADNRTDMRAELEKGGYQLVISDYNIPGFSGEEALELVKEINPDIPFILVSGAVGEEAAVSMMKAGASDYLMKDSLFKLSETVRRELKEAFIRKQHRESTELLKANEAKYRAFIDQSMMAILLARPGGLIQESNIAASTLFGYTPEEFRQLGREHLLDLSGSYAKEKLAERSTSGRTRAEMIGIKKNGERFYCEVASVIFKDINDEDLASAMISDITARKTAEKKLRETNKELKELSRHLKNVREDERRFIAREVHDQLGQLATALKIDVDWLVLKISEKDSMTQQRIHHIETVIDTLLGSIRQISANLRPSILDDFGLNVAMEWQCAELKQQQSIETSFITELDDTALTLEQKTELYRISQEALTNVLRHAGADIVEVKLWENDDYVFLSVCDNGNGFDTTISRNSLGLVGLRERAASLQGELQIKSIPGGGTTISVTIPKNLQP